MDAEALGSLSRRSRTALKRYFERRRIMGADADDAIQEVFVRLARRVGLADARNMEGYLFEAAASVAVDHFRRANSRSASRHEEFQDALHAALDASAEQIFLAREDLGVLVTALRELPAKTRNIFLLSRLEGLKYAEIGVRLGLSVSAVEKHVVKATVHLGRRMRGRGR